MSQGMMLASGGGPTDQATARRPGNLKRSGSKHRSASSPPCIALLENPARKPTRTSTSTRSPQADCRAIKEGADTSRSGNEAIGNSTGIPPPPSEKCPRTISAPVPRNTEPPIEAEAEDFVEGGIELPPEPTPAEECDEETSSFPTRPLPPLGDALLEEFWPRGEGSRALFLDYDGTLREFEARPELATPTREIEELLNAINAREDIVPHIISGRDAQFLGTYFGKLNRFTLIAEHGFQIWRPGSEGFELWDHPDGLEKYHEDWKVTVRGLMTKFVQSTPRSHIEEKASSLVWHYREVEDEARGEAAAANAMDRLEKLKQMHQLDKIRISHGHKVVEVSYRKVTKGPVMRRICEKQAAFGEPFVSVLVAGDDTSDESMFERSPHDFLTVKVGPALTTAKFRVASPEELRRFLWQIISWDNTRA